MNKIFIILFLLFSSSLITFAQEPFPHNIGTIYEYSQDDIPDVCFFPTEKARWDGYDVTIDKWGQLTDFQKVTFLREAIEEINRNIDGQAHLTVDPETFAHSIDEALNIASTKLPDPKIPVITFVFAVLKDTEMIHWPENSDHLFKGMA